MKNLIWTLFAVVLALAGCKSSDGSTDTHADAGSDSSTASLDGSMITGDATTQVDGTVVVQSDASAEDGASRVVTVMDGGDGDASVADAAVDAGPTTLAMEDFPRAIAALFCADPTCNSWFRQSSNEAMMLRGDVEACTARYTPYVRAWVDIAVGPAYRAGRLSYDGAAAYACVTEAATSCDNIMHADVKSPFCLFHAFHGTVASGESCRNDTPVNECASANADCVRNDWSCLGTCVEGTIAPGGACTDSSECLPGDQGATCESGQCIQFASAERYARVGEMCGRDPVWPPTSFISVEYVCEHGLYCDRETNQCATRKAEHAVCIDTSQCEPGFACTWSGETGRCERYATTYSTRVGDPCNRNDDTMATLCDIDFGLTCHRGDGDVQTCVALGDGTLGSVCMNEHSTGASSCNDGLACMNAADWLGAGTCTDRSGEGESCDGASCEEGLECITNVETSRNECSTPPAMCSPI